MSPYLRCLDDVELVEGLTANLISISQLCDQVLDVIYKKSECIVTRKDRVVLMKGSISKDNYYMWISQPSSKVKSMDEIISEDDVKGLPKLNIE